MNPNVSVPKLQFAPSDNDTSRFGLTSQFVGGPRSSISHDGLPVLDLDDKLSLAVLSGGTSGGLPNE